MGRLQDCAQDTKSTVATRNSSDLYTLLYHVESAVFLFYISADLRDDDMLNLKLLPVNLVGIVYEYMLQSGVRRHLVLSMVSG